MPNKKIDFDAVRRLGLRLPKVEEGTTYGSPSLKVGGKMLACLPTHKSAEPDSLAVSIDFHYRDALLQAAPDTYYLTDHYVNYPVVLVRLSRIRSDELGNLLGMSWRFVTMKTRRGSRRIQGQKESLELKR